MAPYQHWWLNDDNRDNVDDDDGDDNGDQDADDEETPGHIIGQDGGFNMGDPICKEAIKKVIKTQ